MSIGWIKTDWIDGAGGITELTSIDITANDGKLTMDALNLQQKVYNMLNRIAVSGGTYRDWLETVYTAGKYLDRPETPVFIGGMTQYIEFDEVISKSATETASKGMKHVRFDTDWNKHGRAAGPIRNKQMAEYGDALLIIWDGE